MADDGMLNRIGRIAKDKMGKGKDWVDSGADSSSSLNVRGAAGGAVLGGLVAGPLGAVVGGWLGKGAGLSKAAEDAELARAGLTREEALRMKDLVEDLRDTEASKALLAGRVVEAKDRVATLTKRVDASYEMAKAALEKDDEAGARTFLADKLKAQEELSQAEAAVVVEEGREKQAALLVQQLEDQLMAIEDKARRTLTGELDPFAGGAMDGTIRDPLLEQFDKWEKEGK